MSIIKFNITPGHLVILIGSIIEVENEEESYIENTIMVQRRMSGGSDLTDLASRHCGNQDGLFIWSHLSTLHATD